MKRSILIAWGWLMTVIVARPVLAFAKQEQSRARLNAVRRGVIAASDAMKACGAIAEGRASAWPRPSESDRPSDAFGTEHLRREGSQFEKRQRPEDPDASPCESQ